jgi:outer membrane protein OmpA-like peptidoglycan-associated protein/Tol biopolymer transport system component
MNKSVVALFIVLLPIAGFSQVTTAENAKGKAKEYYEAAYISRNLTISDSLGQLAVKEKPNFIDAWELLGKNYLFEKKFEEAANAFEKVKTLGENFRYDLNLTLAKCYIGAEKYSVARERLKAFLQNPKLSASDKMLSQKMLSDCDFGEEALKHPLDINPVNLGPGVNSSLNEAGPYLTADSKNLYYTRVIEDLNKAQEDLYYAVKTGDKYGTGNPVDGLNTLQYGEGAQSISASGKYLLFTSFDRPDGMGNADIYISRKVGNKWERANNVGMPINTPGWDGEPSLSADGRTLLFSSVRSGGYGQRDIWMSVLTEDNSWSAPINLGDSINTYFEEEAPFLHPDGKTLYFSSNGWPGMGTYDLFMSHKLPNGKWSKAVNLGYPINTSGYEVSIFVSTDGGTAYYSTERKDGYGGADIYKFNMPGGAKPEYTSYISGNVFDQESREPIAANVQIFDLETGKLFTSASSDKINGTFLATLPAGKNYAVEVMKDGYLFWSHNISLKDVKEGEPVEVNIPLQKIQVGQAIVLNNIFFESERYDLKNESTAELEVVVKLLTKNPSLKVEIGGHTDNTGSEANNRTLSENRAKSVYDYLVKKGIDASRVSYKGYASSKPAGSNTTAEGKAKNRRTELMVTAI